MKNCNRLLVIAIILILIAATTAFAGQKSWTGTSGTTPTWSQSGNWTPSGVPGTGDSVVIGNASFTGGNQPTITTAVSNIQSLTIGTNVAATLTIGSGGSLTVTGNLYGDISGVASTIAVGAQTFTVQGTATIGGNGSNFLTFSVST